MKFFLFLFLSFPLFCINYLRTNSTQLYIGELKGFEDKKVIWQNGEKFIKISFEKIAYIEQENDDKFTLGKYNLNFIDGSYLFVDNLNLSKKSSFNWLNKLIFFSKNDVKKINSNQNFLIKGSKKQKNFLIKGSKKQKNFLIKGSKKQKNFFLLEDGYFIHQYLDFSSDFTISFSIKFFEKSHKLLYVYFGNFLYIYFDDVVMTVQESNNFIHYSIVNKSKYIISFSWSNVENELSIFINNKLSFKKKYEDFNNLLVESFYIRTRDTGALGFWGGQFQNFQKNYSTDNKDFLLFNNNDFVQGKILEIKDDKVLFLDELGKLNLPFTNIKKISLNQSNVERNEGIELLLVGNQKLYIKDFLVSNKADEFRVKTYLFGDLFISKKLVNFIIFP